MVLTTLQVVLQFYISIGSLNLNYYLQLISLKFFHGNITPFQDDRQLEALVRDVDTRCGINKTIPLPTVACKIKMLMLSI